MIVYDYGNSCHYAAGSIITRDGFLDESFSLKYSDSELIIYTDRIDIVGNIKDAARALVKEIINYHDKSIACNWNGILFAYYGKNDYKLHYTGKEVSFFPELKKEYERIFKLKVFM